MPFVRFAAPATPFGFPAADPFVDLLAAALAAENQSPCAAKAGNKPAHCAPRRRIVKRVITPNFDISEREGEYVLEGELPGVSNKSSISIDFEDAQTIVIKGEVSRPVRQQNKDVENLVSLTEEALQASAAQADKGETKNIATDGETIVYDDAASTTSSKKNPHHVTVEDEVDESETASNASFEVVDGPVLTKADKGKAAARDADVEMTEAAEKPSQTSATPAEAAATKTRGARYWISERPIGVFERKFKFQGLIDQDNVRAYLENGLLTIVVPKREAYVRQVFIH